VRDVVTGTEPGRAAEAALRLAALGLPTTTLDRPVGNLSGGERVRVELARILLEHPDLLVLDEPGNHLDLLAREALETALAGYHGALVTVSHDRALIERLGERRWEVREGRLSESSAPPGATRGESSPDFRDNPWSPSDLRGRITLLEVRLAVVAASLPTCGDEARAALDDEFFALTREIQGLRQHLSAQRRKLRP
jgi:macrolide transport system ATP-binding/permease protein